MVELSSESPSLSIPLSMPTRRKVLSMRYMGYESEEISQVLGLSVKTVQSHINAAVSASANTERVTLVREAEMSKLEQIEEAFIPAAIGEATDIEGLPIPPQASAAKVVLDVMDRRAKLMGIDKVQPQTSIGNLTLIQILSQLPSPGQPPLGQNSNGSGSTPPPLAFSREAEDA